MIIIKIIVSNDTVNIVFIEQDKRGKVKLIIAYYLEVLYNIDFLSYTFLYMKASKSK